MTAIEILVVTIAVLLIYAIVQFVTADDPAEPVTGEDTMNTENSNRAALMK